MNTIKVAILDDHLTLTQSLKEKISKEKDIEVVVAEDSWDSFWPKVRDQEIDLVILDIRLDEDAQGDDGLEVAEFLKTDKPYTKVLISSVSSTQSDVKRAVDLGVSGYLLKIEPVKKLVKAIRGIVNKSEMHYSKKIEKIIREGFVHLTEKEKVILAYISRGLNVPQIAKTSGMSRAIINTHKKNIMSKLDIHNVEALVKWGIKNGYDRYPLP